MATLRQGILGGFSGKVGTVVGFTRKGISYIRGLATSFTNPNTPAQQEQRAKFALVIKFLRPLVALLRIGFKQAGSVMSGFNAAMAYTLSNAVKGSYPNHEIDFPKVRICQGNLPGALNADAVSSEAGKIVFSWDNNAQDFGAAATDKVVLMAHSALLNKSVSIIGAGTRLSGTQELIVPDSFSGSQVQTYIGFCNEDQTEFSNGEFLKAVLVA